MRQYAKKNLPLTNNNNPPNNKQSLDNSKKIKTI